jgi:hypothetical protein
MLLGGSEDGGAAEGNERGGAEKTSGQADQAVLL